MTRYVVLRGIYRSTLKRISLVDDGVIVRRGSCAVSEMLGGDLVATWDVALSDNVYKIEFAHGTTTGKRIVYVNGKVVVRKDWLFKLVGKETFTVGSTNTKATILIEAVGGFAYEYTLEVDGKSLQKFIDNRAKTSKTWLLKVKGEDCRVVLEKDTMDIWCNGQKMDTKASRLLETEVAEERLESMLSGLNGIPKLKVVQLPDTLTLWGEPDIVGKGEFVEDGTETHFSLGEHECCIKATSGGKKKSSIVHSLLLDGEKVPASTQ